MLVINKYKHMPCGLPQNLYHFALNPEELSNPQYDGQNYNDLIENYQAKIDAMAASTTTGSRTGSRPDESKFRVEDLKAVDFGRVELRGEGSKYFYSYFDEFFECEITLEPTFAGFSVAVYDQDHLLQSPKVSTNEKEYCKSSFINKELFYGTQERSTKTWNKALALANKVMCKKRAEYKIKKWGLTPDLNHEKDIDGVMRAGRYHVPNAQYYQGDAGDGSLNPTLGGQYTTWVSTHPSTIIKNLN